MLKNDFEVREVKNITNLDKQRIEDFLQGAVYCWCKNNKDKWFALRDLMGGENFDWRGTPLFNIYKKNEDKDNAISLTGKDMGWLLKKVIKNDQRYFDTKKEEMTRKYKWDNTKS
ncbi:hypothetical protein [Arcobacter sp. YIC-310]|uniref:hypothetical protein n=1 Tax=Arcobacter sp. YIC-310 TaxID=3376632 RepID=UPI003C13FD89